MSVTPRAPIRNVGDPAGLSQEITAGNTMRRSIRLDPTGCASGVQPQPLDLVRLQEVGIPAIRWVAEPYIIQGEIHLLLGDGSTGKTFLALDTALGLAAGKPVFIDCPVTKPYRVLYVDEDGSRAQICRRLMGLAAGRGIRFDAALAERLAVYTGCGFAFDTGTGVQKLLEAIDRHKPEILTIDALRALHQGNENDSRDITRVLRHFLRRVARKHDLTCLVLHHTSKGPDDLSGYVFGRSAARASRGSTEIRNAVDTVLYVERMNSAAKLTIDKTRSLDDSDKPDPLGFAIREDAEGALRILRAELGEAPKRPKLQRAKDDLKTALPEGSTEELTHSKLMECLLARKDRDYGVRTARDALKSLVPSVFTRREAGKNVFYRRASRDSGNAAK